MARKSAVIVWIILGNLVSVVGSVMEQGLAYIVEAKGLVLLATEILYAHGVVVMVIAYHAAEAVSVEIVEDLVRLNYPISLSLLRVMNRSISFTANPPGVCRQMSTGSISQAHLAKATTR